MEPPDTPGGFKQLSAGLPAVTGLDRPLAASNSLITHRRSTNSLTAAIPATPVNVGSGAPTRTRPRNSRTLPTR
jgi:hypothetical protein